MSTEIHRALTEGSITVVTGGGVYAAANVEGCNRVLWNTGEQIENRPALDRRNPAYEAASKDSMNAIGEHR